MTDLFKLATKNKYRFYYKGYITVEDLWDLPVEELDAIYKNLRSQQKYSEDSLLNNKEASKEDILTNNKIDIIKTIVNDKIEEVKRNADNEARRARNQHILEIMANKQDDALREKSLEELQAMLDSDSEDNEE